MDIVLPEKISDIVLTEKISDIVLPENFSDIVTPRFFLQNGFESLLSWRLGDSFILLLFDLDWYFLKNFHCEQFMKKKWGGNFH